MAAAGIWKAPAVFPALYVHVDMELQYYFTRPVVCGAQWSQSLSTLEADPLFG